MAACIDVSRGTAYGLSMSQMALALGSTLFFPAMRVQVFAAQPNVINGTMLDEGGLKAQIYTIAVAPLLLFSAAWTLWFSFITMSLQDKGCLSCDYTPEAIESTGIWDIA